MAPNICTLIPRPVRSRSASKATTFPSSIAPVSCLPIPALLPRARIRIPNASRCRTNNWNSRSGRRCSATATIGSPRARIARPLTSQFPMWGRTAITQAIASAFERCIAAAPADWHMFQAGWPDVET